SLTKTSFTVDVMPETYQATNLKNLKKGQIVNLEPALKMSDRFGGHFVSGHIDDVGQIIGRKREANAVVFEIQCPTALKNYILSKGAIAIDGISLTVVQVTKNTFSVSIIPHTLAETN